MSQKQNVFPGEAPESDSEDELNISNGIAINTECVVRGRVVTGEAPESDEEIIGNSSSLDSISSALSASSLDLKKEKKKSPSKKGISLLEKKLCERNCSLAKNMTDLVSSSINNANNDLNSADQLLLKCQVKVQETADILKTLLNNVNKIDDKLRAILPNNYIPDITQPDEKLND